MSIQIPKDFNSESQISEHEIVLRNLKTVFAQIYGSKIKIEISDTVSSMGFSAKEKKIIWGTSFVKFLMEKFPDISRDAVLFGALHEGMHYIDYLDNPKFFLDNMHSNKPGSIEHFAESFSAEYMNSRSHLVGNYSVEKIKRFMFSKIFNFYNCIDDIWVNKNVISSFSRFSTDRSIMSDIYSVLFEPCVDKDNLSIDVSSLPIFEQFGVFPLIYSMITRTGLKTQRFKMSEDVSGPMKRCLKSMMTITDIDNNAQTRYKVYGETFLPYFKELLFKFLDEKIEEINNQDQKSQNGDSQDQQGDSQDQQGDSQDQQGDSQEQKGGSQEQQGGSQEQQGGSENQQGSRSQRPSNGTNPNPKSLDDLFGQDSTSHPVISKEDLEEAIKGDPVESAKQTSNEKINDALKKISSGLERGGLESVDVTDIEEAREFYYKVLEEIGNLSSEYAEKVKEQLEGFSADRILDIEYSSYGSLDIRELVKRAPGVFVGEIPDQLPPVYRREVESLDPNKIPSVHVSFVLDCSGSMASNVEDVKKFMICLSRMFIAYQDFLEDKNDLEFSMIVYDCEPTKIMPIPDSNLTINEQFIACLPYIGARGGNNEPPAFELLEDSSHDIKLLFWITDGATNSANECAEFINPLIASGWKTFGIGIDSQLKGTGWDALFTNYDSVKTYRELLQIVYFNLTNNI